MKKKQDENNEKKKAVSKVATAPFSKNRSPANHELSLVTIAILFWGQDVAQKTLEKAPFCS